MHQENIQNPKFDNFCEDGEAVGRLAVVRPGFVAAEKSYKRFLSTIWASNSCG